jgi:TRAP-type uncharacterized transport system substrate-binding protein
MRKTIMALGMSVAMIMPVYAQDVPKLIISVGSETGTYMKLVKELSEVCKSVTIDARTSSGSPENMDRLKNNRVSAAFMQSDILFHYKKQSEEYLQFPVLVVLHTEEIHVLALRESGLKEGGIAGFNKKDVVFSDLSDLKKRKVGAAGGSVITSKILAGEGDVDYETVEFTKTSDAITGLERGQVHAVVIVGGAPLSDLEKLDHRKFKLIPVGKDITNRVDKIYRKTAINYPNLRSDTLPTVAANAVIVTRQYNSPGRQVGQIAFRKCFMEKIEELKETPETHAKWQVIKPWERIAAWPWYKLDGDKVPTDLPEPDAKK